MQEVRQERTFWRDEGLSQLHRTLGMNCPMTDIDFLALEFDRCKASLLVEYKNEHAKIVDPNKNASYKALIDLGNRAGLPVIECRYSDNYSAWCPKPLNINAFNFIHNNETMTLYEWTRLLYKIRGRELTPEEFRRFRSNSHV